LHGNCGSVSKGRGIYNPDLPRTGAEKQANPTPDGLAFFVEEVRGKLRAGKPLSGMDELSSDMGGRVGMKAGDLEGGWVGY